MEIIMIKNLINEIKDSSVYTYDGEVNMKFRGIFSDSVKFIERNQLCDVELWKKFVNQFRINADGKDGHWRCEFWGKMMRGACMIVSYTKDDGFYRIIEGSVRDMLTTQDEFGRFSTYELENEFKSWDMWGRKYVLLGFMYFLEICRDDELAKAIIEALCRHADYILEQVGEDKIPITKTSAAWQGLNSCSILEPIVRLYRLTGKKRYLDFAEYIISTGFIDGGDLVELAYKNEVAPHEYPVVKAYEMMSCFEGLLQYYKITGIEKYKKACLNLGYRIIEGELSVIGCSGCTHELFDHTSVKQTQTDYKGIVQETCVTVTWMRFAEALLEISGDSVFADAIEQSFYNAYLGAFNTERALTSRFPRFKDVPQVMPFDSYSPLVANNRGREIGGYCVFEDGSFYGCCACIAAAGSGIMPRYALLRSEGGLVLNFYESGVIHTKTPKGKDLTIKIGSLYPKHGSVSVHLTLNDPEDFEIMFRIPAWCKEAKITINDEARDAVAGYCTVEREWKDGDVVELDLKMYVQRILPPEGADNQDKFAAYMRGPIVLAADARLNDMENPIRIACDDDGIVDANLVNCYAIKDVIECVAMDTDDGEEVRLIDYSSAGKTWTGESKCAAWILLEEIE